jgi:hypothetical protein
MKRTLASLMFVGLISTGAAAYAQDRMGQDPAQRPSTEDQYSSMAPNQSTTTASTSKSSKHEAMKDCVAREQADNSTMSKSDARKACHDALKAQRDAQQGDRQDNEPRPQQ